MMQQQNKAITAVRNTWNKFQQGGCKHALHIRALQGAPSSIRLGLCLHTHLQSSSRHTLFQLHINGVQEALSCYSQSTPIEHSLMHILTLAELPPPGCLLSAFVLLTMPEPYDSCMLRDLEQEETNLFEQEV